MFRIHSFILFLVISLPILIPCLIQAEEKATPQYGARELSLASQSYPKGIKEDDLKDLPINDPKLRVAYYFFIMTANGGPQIVDTNSPEMEEVMKDIKQRGDSATPLWLDIMEKNSNTNIESYTPNVIERIGTINMEPYVGYFRGMIQTRAHEIDAWTAGEMLKIFFKHGTEEDVKMVRNLADNGPIMASAIETAFETEQRRNAPPSTQPSSLKSVPEQDQTENPQAQWTALTTSNVPSWHLEKSGSSTPWLVMTVGLIVAALGLLWFLLRRRS